MKRLELDFQKIKECFDSDNWDLGYLSEEHLNICAQTPIKDQFHPHGWNFTNNIRFNWGGVCNGIVLIKHSVIALDYFANTISAALLLFTILFYVFIYTIWLKRKTPQNIVIGGAAGALPPVIGWTIATNSLSLEPITFFLIIFFWTPSHFWALSLYKSDDYKKAKIPMLPLTNGIESTKINILVYSLLMLPMIVLPYAIDLVGLVFLVPALLLTLYYNLLCFQLYKYKKNKFNSKKAKTIFGYSILYLFLIFVIFLIDKIL